MKQFVLLSLLCISIIAKAQDTSKAKVITYDPFNTSTIDTKTDIKIDMNTIKWNVSLLSRGIFLFDYERVITKHLSLEAGIGITYRDYSFEMFNNAMMSNNSFYLDNNETNTNLVIKPGFAFNASPRIYPTDGYMEGFYFAPIFRFRNYNIQLEDPVFYNDSTNADQTFRGSNNFGYKTSEYGFLIGYQTEQSSWFDITWDYYFGVSFRNNTYKDLKYKGTSLTIVDKTSSFPSILFGIKIGILQF